MLSSEPTCGAGLMDQRREHSHQPHSRHYQQTHGSSLNNTMHHTMDRQTDRQTDRQVTAVEARRYETLHGFMWTYQNKTHTHIRNEPASEWQISTQLKQTPTLNDSLQRDAIFTVMITDCKMQHADMNT